MCQLKVSEGTPQMLITSDFSAFTGRIAIGRVERGVLKKVCQFLCVKEMV
jgi:GTP-binding protein